MAFFKKGNTESNPMGTGAWRRDRAHHSEWASKDYEDGNGVDNSASRQGVRRHNKAGMQEMKENKEKKNKGR